jgi:hypothetical protein
MHESSNDSKYFEDWFPVLRITTFGGKPLKFTKSTKSSSSDTIVKLFLRAKF